MLLCKFGKVSFYQSEISIWNCVIGGVATAGDFAACDTMTECLDRIKSVDTTDIAVIWPRC